MPFCVGGTVPTTVPTLAPGQSREITSVTRRDIFDFLRAQTGPWWGRLGETGFLGQLYDLDALPSTDPRHATAAEDITRHRIANIDWDDDWVFDDHAVPARRRARPGAAGLPGPDGPPAGPARHRPGHAAGAALNILLAPDGWELRTGGFISGRPVYAASRTANGPGRMIRLQIGDDDAGKLDIVLGQAHHLLGENGDALAQNLIQGATLALRRDGGILPPDPRNNWTECHLRGHPDGRPLARVGVHHQKSTDRVWRLSARCSGTTAARTSSPW